MKVDKNFLVNYIDKDNAYLFNLYKIYELRNKLPEEKKQREYFDNCEDKIFTVNGNVLSQKDRIIYELKRIYKKIELIQNSEERDNFCEELHSLMQSVDNIKDDEKNDSLYFVLKEKIVLLEAKLDIPITFLNSAGDLFDVMYNSKYINKNVFSKDSYKDNINIKKYNKEEK